MKLSIITINYNNKEGLQKTIDSVVCQTWRDFEWIIIDGGSTDGSKELIEQYQQHFAYWCSEPDKGVYNAMNKGIAKAKGEYMLFLNSGDVLYEQYVLEAVFSRKLYGDMVYGDWYMIDDQGTSVFQKSPNRISVGFFYSDNICHQAMFVKSSVLKLEGYDEKFQVYADWARWMKMCLDGAKFQYVPVAVCEFDARGGLSKRDFYKLEGELNIIRKAVPDTFRVDIEENISLKKELGLCKMELFQYKQSNLIQDTYMLMNDRLLYSKLVHLSLICIKYLKKMVDLLNIR